MMPPHKYVCYRSQNELLVLERRLEARVISGAVMAVAAVLAGLLWSVVTVPLHGFFVVVAISAGVHAVWCGVRAAAIVRKIRRLREELRA